VGAEAASSLSVEKRWFPGGLREGLQAGAELGPLHHLGTCTDFLWRGAEGFSDSVPPPASPPCEMWHWDKKKGVVAGSRDPHFKDDLV